LRNVLALSGVQACLHSPRACVARLLGQHPTVANIRGILPYVYRSNLPLLIRRFDEYRDPTLVAARPALPDDFAFYWSNLVVEVVEQATDEPYDYRQLQAWAKTDVEQAGHLACRDQRGRPKTAKGKRAAKEMALSLTVPPPPSRARLEILTELPPLLPALDDDDNEETDAEAVGFDWGDVDFNAF